MSDSEQLDNPPSNERLAEVYEAEYFQGVIIWPLYWVHEPYGNWRLHHRFDSNSEFKQIKFEVKIQIKNYIGMK